MCALTNGRRFGGRVGDYLVAIAGFDGTLALWPVALSSEGNDSTSNVSFAVADGGAPAAAVQVNDAAAPLTAIASVVRNGGGKAKATQSQPAEFVLVGDARGVLVIVRVSFGNSARSPQRTPAASALPPEPHASIVAVSEALAVDASARGDLLSLCFSGARAVSGIVDCRLFDSGEGPAGATCIALSSDGRLGLFCSEPDYSALWPAAIVATGEVPRCLALLGGVSTGFEPSIAVGGNDGVVRLWDVAAESSLQRAVADRSAAPEPALVFAASEARSVRLEASSGVNVGSAGWIEKISSAVTADSAFVLAFSRAGDVTCWRASQT